MKKLIRFLLLTIVATAVSSCMTTSYVKSYDDPLYNEGGLYSSGLFNPYGYDLFYSSNWGYYYYNPYKTRFLFDDYIYYNYPNLRSNRHGHEHWDYQNYNQHSNKNSNQSDIQKRGRDNNSVRRSTPIRNTSPNSTMRRQNIQKNSPVRNNLRPTTRQNVQMSNPTRSTYQRQSTTQRRTTQNRSSSTSRKR